VIMSITAFIQIFQVRTQHFTHFDMPFLWSTTISSRYNFVRNNLLPILTRRFHFGLMSYKSHLMWSKAI
jgi:hypothetical protein